MICPHCKHDNPKNASVCSHCGRSPSQTAPFLLETGQILAGRYEILSELGRGGMGVVFKAHDRALDEIVAVKVLLTYAAPSDDLARRFRSEIKLARRVVHPNVCRIYEYGEIGDLRFITMEFIDGQDLRTIVRRDGPFAPEEACDIGLEVASALEAIHAVHIIHRDLKTVNLMRDASGVVRLMDFGIAKAHRQEGATDVTATGMIIGTPEYMSPEQARGVKVSAQSDIYSFGVVMYELVTGEVPFKGDTPLATILKHIQQPPNIDPARVPAPVLYLLKKALAKDPADRYGSARELGDAIREVKAALAGGYPALTCGEPTPTVGLTRTTLRPATGAPVIPLPTQRAHERSWLSWRVVALAWLALSGAVLLIGVIAFLRYRMDESRVPPVVAPAATIQADARETPADSIVPARVTPEAASPPTTMSAAPRRSPAPSATSPAGQPSARVALRLEPPARQSPEFALEPARRSAQSEERHERPEAPKGMDAPRAAADVVAFILSEMSFTPPPTIGNPPGFEAPQSGAHIRPAQAPAPRLQLAIEMAPAQLRLGDPYSLRYSAFNRSSSQVRIGAMTIRNGLGGGVVTGGAVDPLVRSIIPKTRALLLETSATWQNDPAASWTTTLTVVLDDGSSYVISLRSTR